MWLSSPIPHSLEGFFERILDELLSHLLVLSPGKLHPSRLPRSVHRPYECLPAYQVEESRRRVGAVSGSQSDLSRFGYRFPQIGKRSKIVALHAHC
jgi:hypothetical protein